MVVLILEKVPASVRGELTRWLLELRAGVFIGNISGAVRDGLWKMVCEKMRGGTGMLLHSAANEQGFSIRYAGETSRVVEDFEGLILIRVRSGNSPLTHEGELATEGR